VANTEGSGSYTPSVQSLRNDGVVDVNAGFTTGSDGQPQTNATANRVRGIGVPGSSQNYYPSISQVPFDAYNVQSIEISRGPNSMLFGMGSPAGIVNASNAQAVLNRDSQSASFRTDDRGSFRGSFSFNQGLINDKLAIYGAVR
jgi:outer membrane receptor protein involved in Fe transport